MLATTVAIHSLFHDCALGAALPATAVIFSIMNIFRQALINFRNPWVMQAAAVLVLVAFIGGAAGCAASRGEAKHAGPEIKVAANSAEPKTLSGAELYAINCNRCHPERSAVERNAAEWETLMIHMRVRANLPAGQANAILAYLQADSGN